MQRFSKDTPVTALSGVGKARAEALCRLGIDTLGDLVYYFPRAFENRSDVRLLSRCDFDVTAAFILTVATEPRTARLPKGLTVSKLRMFDDSGSCELTFFNSPFVKDVFHVGSTFRIFGKPSFRKGKIEFTNPKYEPYVEGIPLPDLIPVYSKTDGLSSKQIDKLIKIARRRRPCRLRYLCKCHSLLIFAMG